MLSDFLRFSGVTFASVDTSADKRVLARTWNLTIPSKFHVDIQDVYEIPGHVKAGMSTLAALLIDPWYKDMKKMFSWQAHSRWEKPQLDRINLKYAAIDGFVAYKIFCMILLKKGDGSSRASKRLKRAH